MQDRLTLTPIHEEEERQWRTDKKRAFHVEAKIIEFIDI